MVHLMTGACPVLLLLVLSSKTSFQVRAKAFHLMLSPGVQNEKWVRLQAFSFISLLFLPRTAVFSSSLLRPFRDSQLLAVLLEACFFHYKARVVFLTEMLPSTQWHTSRKKNTWRALHVSHQLSGTHRCGRGLPIALYTFSIVPLICNWERSMEKKSSCLLPSVFSLLNYPIL